MRTRLLALLILLVVGLVLPSAGAAHDRSWPAKKLAALLPEAANFAQKQVQFTPAQLGWLEKNLGKPVRTEDRAPFFYVGTDAGGRSLGVVVLLDADGVNGKIEMGEAIDPAGKLLRVVLFEHGEGAAVEKRLFLDQFSGKSANDRFRVGEDLTAPESAAKSAQVVADAARRGLLMAMAGLRLGQAGGS
ncbi:MAG: hypothetical protein ACOZNI_12655 [Myxococcota bacterium]